MHASDISPAWRALAWCGLLALGGVAGAEPRVADFHVGNSLTVDAEVIAGQGLDGILQTAGITRMVGWQVASGSPLHRHWTETYPADKPREPNVSEPIGRWRQAFSSHVFHAVTLQPFYRNATAQQELEALVGLIHAIQQNPANESTAIWLYPGFPGTPGFEFPVTSDVTFASVWEAPLAQPLTGEATWICSAAGVAWIVAEAEAATGVELRVVPIGEVLSALDAKLRAEPAAGFDSVWDLYRDELHLGPRRGDDPDFAGKYVATLTMAAALYGLDATQTALPERFVATGVDPAFAAVVRDVVAARVPSQRPSGAATHGDQP